MLKMVEDRGFEPLTSAMRRQRSPAELVPHKDLLQIYYNRKNWP